MQAAVSGSHGGWQNNALHHFVLICLGEALQAPCLPKSLFTTEVILLHDLPVDTTARTLPSVKHLLAVWLHLLRGELKGPRPWGWADTSGE